MKHHSPVFMKSAKLFSTQFVMIVFPLLLITFVAPQHLSKSWHRQGRGTFSHSMSALMCLHRARPLQIGKNASFVPLCLTLTSSLTPLKVGIQHLRGKVTSAATERSTREVDVRTGTVDMWAATTPLRRAR